MNKEPPKVTFKIDKCWCGAKPTLRLRWPMLEIACSDRVGCFRKAEGPVLDIIAMWNVDSRNNRERDSA